MEATAYNVSNIVKDEQDGQLTFTVNGQQYHTNIRGDGLYQGDRKLCGYQDFTVGQMDTRNSKTYLLDWLQSHQL